MMKICNNTCERRRYKEDTNYRLVKQIRSCLNSAVNNHQTKGAAIQDLGCFIDEFKLYIENQFESGMTWNNHGTVWEYDHVIPLSSYNLTDRMEYLEACNWLNVRPLLITDNRNKGAKV